MKGMPGNEETPGHTVVGDFQPRLAATEMEQCGGWWMVVRRCGSHRLFLSTRVAGVCVTHGSNPLTPGDHTQAAPHSPSRVHPEPRSVG